MATPRNTAETPAESCGMHTDLAPVVKTATKALKLYLILAIVIPGALAILLAIGVIVAGWLGVGSGPGL